MVEYKIIKQIEKDFPDYLYHYTSVQTLYKIFNNSELWLCNISTMNDKNEVIEYYKSFRKEIIYDCPNPVKSIEEMFDKVNNNLKEHYPYAMCFSKLRDDAAQWERYGDHAAGVCISFDSKKICDLLKKLPIHIASISYGGDSSNKNDIAYIFAKRYFNGEKIFQLQENDDQPSDYIEYLLINCVYSASYYKHKSFEAEQEYRLIVWGSIEDICPKNKYFEHSFECINGIIKQIVKMKLSLIFDIEKISFGDIINEIIIGPRSQQDIHTLKCFIDSKECGDFSKKIVKSDCPLR